MLYNYVRWHESATPPHRKSHNTTGIFHNTTTFSTTQQKLSQHNKIFHNTTVSPQVTTQQKLLNSTSVVLWPVGKLLCCGNFLLCCESFVLCCDKFMLCCEVFVLCVVLWENAVVL